MNYIWQCFSFDKHFQQLKLLMIKKIGRFPYHDILHNLRPGSIKYDKKLSLRFK